MKLIPALHHLTFLFLTSSPCRWLIWRNDPPEVVLLTGLTTRTGRLRLPERPLTSTVVPFPKRAPLQMLLLLTDRDLYRPSSNEVVPAVCRSVWDLTLRDIWKRAGRRCGSRPVLKVQAVGIKLSVSCQQLRLIQYLCPAKRERTNLPRRSFQRIMSSPKTWTSRRLLGRTWTGLHAVPTPNESHPEERFECLTVCTLDLRLLLSLICLLLFK